MFLQLHGSILPKMIIPLLAVGAWATIITCISKYKTYSTIDYQAVEFLQEALLTSFFSWY